MPTVCVVGFIKAHNVTRYCRLSLSLSVCLQVVIRVAASDVFWSRSTPSFSSPHSPFQYLNLHAYGKTGCILAHLFPPVSLAIDSLTDEEVNMLRVAECWKEESWPFACN